MRAHVDLDERQAALLRCLGEPTRLKILKLLLDGEKCVAEITDALGKEQSLISFHLKVLKACRVVRDRQEAQRCYYSIAHPCLAGLMQAGEAIARGCDQSLWPGRETAL